MLFNNYKSVFCTKYHIRSIWKGDIHQIVVFFGKSIFFYNKQFGFSKLHSTSMALVLLIDKLANAIKKGEYGIGVFLDFSKAFDTVDHIILLSELYHYGIRGIVLSWFSSYLSNHKQYVSYNNVSSNIKTISCGVRQDSILGPVLFLLYVGDLTNVCKCTMPFLFADDSNLFSSDDDLSVLQYQTNEELQNISKWLKVNKLSLNTKNHFFIFSGRKVRNSDVALNIGGISINKEGNNKFWVFFWTINSTGKNILITYPVNYQEYRYDFEGQEISKWLFPCYIVLLFHIPIYVLL